MSNYTKTTNFASKDNLSPGNPLKIVKGTEIDTEFNNIQTAVATKTDNASAAITGGSITGITDLAVADGGTGASTATAALNNLLPTQTGNANKYLQTDGTNATWDAVSLSTSDITGTLPVANGGTGVTSSTGTGSVVLSNSPTLVTPALGTPASGTATNLTGLPISTGVSGLGTGVATFLGTPSSANLASAVTDETGSGALVFANSPTLVTPALGTPSALVGTNITGTASGLTAGNVTTNANLTGAVTSVGNATSLGSFSSSNLAGALTDETGSGSAVFATSPTLVTPILGTPTSATLTNATGLPISTGVSGLGTGVATALAVNTGSSGAVVVNGGALGTPSGGTATNLTGLPLTTGVTGTLPVANGGTGTATPSIVAGTNVTVTGTWPNQTIAASGGGGTPGGSTTQVQYNNAGAFGGITGATTDGTSLTLVAPILGTPASGVVTNLTGTASININGTVGATTANTGAFTSISSTLGVNTPNTFGFKNRIINGDMRIDQRNAGASYTQVNGQYSLDRWSGNSFDGGAATNKFSVIQSSTAPTGFSKSLLVTSLAATADGASNIFNIEQKIEGFNFADFAYGTASAQTLTLSFWVRSSLTGTFGGALKNSARNRAYPFTYTISSANTFEQKTITITGDTTGTWVGGTNGTGLWISFGLGVGSTYSGTAGAWGGGDVFSATGATSVVGTNGATFYLTGVQLEKGSTATSFDVRPYATEFTLCQRYFQTLVVSTGTGAFISGFVADSASTGFGVAFLPVPMRTAPALSITLAGGTTKYRVNAGTVNDNSDVNPVISGSTPTSFRLNFNSGFSALTANASGWITNRDSTTGYFGATAEL